MERACDIKNHPYYKEGYSRGYQEGMQQAILNYQNLLNNAKPTEIHVKCEDFANCPYKHKEVSNG